MSTKVLSYGGECYSIESGCHWVAQQNVSYKTFDQWKYITSQIIKENRI